MYLVLKQTDKKEVKKAITQLAASEGVKLPQLAEAMGTTYQKLFQKLCAQYIEMQFLKEIVQVLNDQKEGRKIAIFGDQLNLVFASSSGQRIELKTESEK